VQESSSGHPDRRVNIPTPVQDRPFEPDERPLVARLRSFCFPGGEERARRITRVRTTQVGDIRSSPAARWVSFTADEHVDTTRSAFRWDARMAGGIMGSVTITDAYEDGRGRLVVSKGPLPLKRMTGPDLDKGELQRYLALVAYCPAMLLNHPSLDLIEIGPLTLRARDRNDPTGASVDFDIGDDGRPLGFRAVRPMAAGKRFVLTPWSGTCHDFRELDGFRVPTRLEASWDPPDGSFTYVRIELTSLAGS
jgi:hypothetical protein